MLCDHCGKEMKRVTSVEVAVTGEYELGENGKYTEVQGSEEVVQEARCGECGRALDEVDTKVFWSLVEA